MGTRGRIEADGTLFRTPEDKRRRLSYRLSSKRGWLNEARIVPWGHRDSEREHELSGSPCLDSGVSCLILSLAAEYEWDLGQMDIKAAFLQEE